MKRRYSFVGDDNKPYGEFIVIGSEREGFYWFTKEELNLKHGPFVTELEAYNNAQGFS